MANLVLAHKRFSLRHQLLCSALAFAVTITSLPLHAEVTTAQSYTATLQDILAKDPSHFNERMWDLIRANPQAREQILSESIRLSVQHEIALHPNDKAAILAKFKKLYPQYADQLESYAASAETAPVQEVYSFQGEKKIRQFANDPDEAPSGSHTSWFGRNWPWVLLGGAVAGGATAGIIAASSSSSSSSGDGGGDTLPNPPIIGTTVEYGSQSGLAQINAGAANDAGFTGAGITVAVIDSGVNVQHPDLRNNIAAGGYNFVDNTGTITDTDTTYYHGTHVAGIIAAEKNGFGIRGVAYDAKILPIAAISDRADGTEVAKAFDYATNKHANVINGSFGPNDVANAYFVQDQAQFFWAQARLEAQKLLTYTAQGGIAVFAAGNSYVPGNADNNLINNNPTGYGFLPFIKPANANIPIGQPGAYRASEDGNNLTVMNDDYSALEGHLIVAVAVDSNNQIATFSNHCGVAKNWCIAAPGVDITSTSVTNNYSKLSGTSFSSPHVAGAVAVLLQQHPELTPTQIVNLLLNTATDIGPTGIDDIYGHGLLNLDAAVQSTGPFMVVMGANMSGNQILLNNSSVHAAPAFGNSFANALKGTEIGILDSYTRNFTVSLSDHVSTTLTALDSTTALQRFGQNEFRPKVAIDNNNSVSFTLKAKDGLERAAGDSEQGMDFESYSFTHQLGDQVALNVNHRDVRANALAFSEDDRSLLSSQVSSNGVGNPYLDFVSDGYANNVTVDLPWEGRFRATTAMGAPSLSTVGQDGQRNMLAMGEVGFGDSRSSVTLTTGAMIEQTQMLGMSGTGAFALGQGTTTWFGGVSGHWQLAPKTEMLASFYGGITNGRAANDSLVQDVGSVSSTAWRVGLVQHDVLQEQDRFRMNIAQPLRAESGDMRLSLPQYRLRDGTMIRQDANYALAPTGREIDFEAGYSFTVNDDTKLDFAAMYRRDAGHVAGQNEAIGVSRVSKNF